MKEFGFKKYIIIVVLLLVVIIAITECPFARVFTLIGMDESQETVEKDCQKAMRESWQEGYDQGYSDAFFKLTGDEPND